MDEGQLEFLTVYVRNCAPEAVEFSDLQVPGLFMLWFTALNDLPDTPDRPDIIKQVLDVIDGAPPNNGHDIAIIRVTHDFVDAINERFHGNQSTRLFQRLREYVDASWDEALNTGHLPKVADYLPLCEKTIAVHPYIEIFRLSMGALRSADAQAQYASLEQLAVQCIFMVNDVMHVQRDIRKNKFNLVRCLAKEHQISLEQALDEGERMTRERLSGLKNRYAALMATETDDATRSYAAFLLSMQEGSRLATLQLHERYFGKG